MQYLHGRPHPGVRRLAPAELAYISTNVSRYAWDGEGNAELYCGLDRNERESALSVSHC